MPKRAPKYAEPKDALLSGLRRVTKKELADLGYSRRSVLYTKRNVKHPRKFLTRADVRNVVESEGLIRTQPDRPIFSKSFFAFLKRERFRALEIPRYRYWYSIYFNPKHGVNLLQAADLVEQFFLFIKAKYNPRDLDVLMIRFLSANDAFTLGPRYFSQYNDVVKKLRQMAKNYKSKIKLTDIHGWIELAY